MNYSKSNRRSFVAALLWMTVQGIAVCADSADFTAPAWSRSRLSLLLWLGPFRALRARDD